MKFHVHFFLECIPKLIKAVPLTLYLTIWAFIVGLIFGLILAVIRYKKIPVLNEIARFYVSFIQGTPVMLQLYLVYYVLPYVIGLILNGMGFRFSASMIPVSILVIIALALNVAGFMAETIRGGLNALGEGEIEAAYSIGMTTPMVYRRVIIPEVFVLSIPNLSTNLINILHESSLAYFVTLLEVTGTARILAHNNWFYFESFAASGVIYWVLTAIIELVTMGLEKAVQHHGYNLKTQ